MPAPSAATAPVTILVVEDEPAVRRLACQVLQRHGYLTVEAGDGKEALAVLSATATPIGLVLTDIRMPNLNGLELERLVRERWPAIPVLLMSGEITREWVVEVVHDPTVRLLRKPFTAEALLEALHEMLHSSAALSRRPSTP
jgi:two-component system, cell cycle sensor histidine kinase and response regulator CckA